MFRLYFILNDCVLARIISRNNKGLVNRGHACARDSGRQGAATVTRACCHKSAAMSLITSGILIRSDGISYWNADALGTEIPIPLCVYTTPRPTPFRTNGPVSTTC